MPVYGRALSVDERGPGHPTRVASAATCAASGRALLGESGESSVQYNLL